jgi:hypothetical protein
MSALCLQYALHDLHPGENATIEAMSGTRIRLLPLHCINLDNQL